MKTKTIQIILSCLLMFAFCFHVKAKSGIISDGYYYVRTRSDYSKVLDISNSSVKNGGNLQIWKKDNVTNQIFHLEHTGNDCYLIKALHSDLYIQMADQGASSNVVQGVKTTKNYGKWKITKASSSSYYIKNMNGKYLCLNSTQAANGTNVRTKNKSKSKEFQWIFTKTTIPKTKVNERVVSSIAGNYYKPIEQISHNSILESNYPIWTIKSYVYNSRGKRVLKDSNTTDLLKLNYKVSFNGNDLAPGNYFMRIIAIPYGDGDQWKSPKYSFSIISGTSRKFTNSSKPDVYIIESALKDSLVLNVQNAKTEDWSNVNVEKHKWLNNQRFNIIRYNGNWHEIVDINSGKAVDVMNGSSSEGTNVQIYHRNKTDSQLWQFIDAGNGYYYIQNKLGCFLDVCGGVGKEGTNVWMYHGNGTTAQKWKIKKVLSVG